MLKDKMNCTLGFVSCFLRVSLAYFGSICHKAACHKAAGLVHHRDSEEMISKPHCAVQFVSLFCFFTWGHAWRGALLYHPRGREEILQVLVRVGDGGEVHEVPVQRPLVLHRLRDLAHSLVLGYGLDDGRVLVEHSLDVLRVRRRRSSSVRRHLGPLLGHVHDPPGSARARRRRGSVGRARRRVMSVGMLPGVPGRRGGPVVAACRAIYPSVVSRFTVLSVLILILSNECKLQTLNIFSSVQ